MYPFLQHFQSFEYSKKELKQFWARRPILIGPNFVACLGTGTFGLTIRGNTWEEADYGLMTLLSAIDFPVPVKN